ncbi:MAG: hypothetical protein ACRDV3_06985 [Acidothermaceae bacterium]
MTLAVGWAWWCALRDLAIAETRQPPSSGYAVDPNSPAWERAESNVGHGTSAQAPATLVQPAVVRATSAGRRPHFRPRVRTSTLVFGV